MSKVYEAYLELEEQCSLSNIEQWVDAVESIREEFESEEVENED